MVLYQKLIKPALFRMDPEGVHDRAILIGRFLGSNPVTRGSVGAVYDWQHPMLTQTIAGITFRNPIGLAAGFDKDCRLMRIIPEIGFGFEEVGSITAQPYEGNQRPRLTRLPKDKSIIVHYGLKNEGAKVAAERLKGTWRIPVGVSVAKTNKNYQTDEDKLQDWVAGITALKDVGSYLTINVSCPNTYDPTNFCDPRLLWTLVHRIERDRIVFRKPVFIKITADMSTEQVDQVIELCRSRRWITGFILTNLVKDRSLIDIKSPKEKHDGVQGGLSGKPVMPKALALVRHVHKQAGRRFIIIGCGGIFTAQDAYDYIRGGASLVQLITGMIYGGPGTIKRINKGLVRLLKRDGYANVHEAVGVDAQRRPSS